MADRDGARHHHRVDARRTIILVDDLRSFMDGRSAEVARTSAAGVELLDRFRDGRLDELWLDHDLGGDDTTWPVVEILEQAAFEKRPSTSASSMSTPLTRAAPRRSHRSYGSGATASRSRRAPQTSAISTALR